MSAATYLNTALKTHYNAKASNGTMGILRNGTRVLIIQRRLKNIKIRQDGPPDTWSFAGGGLDPDETPELCIVREMKEELDVDVAIKPIGDEPVWGMTDDNVDDRLWRCTFFVVELTTAGQTVKINEPRKHVKFLWIEWDELWAKIEAEIEGRSEVEESSEQKMRFFPSMKNLVLKYPKRRDPSCLDERLA